MEFGQIEIAEWSYGNADLSSEDILARLVKEAQRAIDGWTLLSVNLDPANDPAHLDFQRVSAEIAVSAELFDAFFNGCTGYRAQYAVSEEAGDRFNRALVDALSPLLLAIESRYAAGVDRDFCRRSLAGPYAKLWFPKSISDLISEPYLMTLPEVLKVPAWRDAWEGKARPRKGILAPTGDPPSVLLNGAFVRRSDDAVWNQKPDRSNDLYRTGWT